MQVQFTSVPRIAYPIPEFAALLGLSTATVYRMAARGELELVRFGRRRLVPAHQVSRLTTAKQ